MHNPYTDPWKALEHAAERVEVAMRIKTKPEVTPDNMERYQYHLILGMSLCLQNLAPLPPMHDEIKIKSAKHLYTSTIECLTIEENSLQWIRDVLAKAPFDLK